MLTGHAVALKACHFHLNDLSRVLTRTCSDRSQYVQSEALAESLCWAIGNLAFPDEDNQSRLGGAGSCEGVVALLNRYR